MMNAEIKRAVRRWALGAMLALAVTAGRAADLSAGYTFADNEKNITAAKLNAVVGSAVVNPAFVTAKTPATSLAAGDLFVLYSQSAAGLRRTSLASLLYNNTNLFSSQTEGFTVDATDWVLTYSTAGAGYRKVAAGNFFTNWPVLMGNPADLVPVLPNLTNNPVFAVFEQGTSNAWRYVPLTNFYTVVAPTNLAAANPLAVTNNELMTIYAPTNGQAQTLSLTNLGIALQTVGFASTNYSITNIGTFLNQAHGFGVTPGLVRAVAVCLQTEGGYAAGDEVNANSVIDSSGGQMVAVGANATNVFCVHRGEGIANQMLQRTGTNVFTLTSAKWALKVYARP